MACIQIVDEDGDGEDDINGTIVIEHDLDKGIWCVVESDCYDHTDNSEFKVDALATLDDDGQWYRGDPDLVAKDRLVALLACNQIKISGDTAFVRIHWKQI